MPQIFDYYIMGISSLIVCYLDRLDEQFSFFRALRKYFLVKACVAFVEKLKLVGMLLYSVYSMYYESVRRDVNVCP